MIRFFLNECFSVATTVRIIFVSQTFGLAREKKKKLLSEQKIRYKNQIEINSIAKQEEIESEHNRNDGIVKQKVNDYKRQIEYDEHDIDCKRSKCKFNVLAEDGILSVRIVRVDAIS